MTAEGVVLICSVVVGFKHRRIAQRRQPLNFAAHLRTVRREQLLIPEDVDAYIVSGAVPVGLYGTIQRNGAVDLAVFRRRIACARSFIGGNHRGIGNGAVGIRLLRDKAVFDRIGGSLAVRHRRRRCSAVAVTSGRDSFHVMPQAETEQHDQSHTA